MTVAAISRSRSLGQAPCLVLYSLDGEDGAPQGDFARFAGDLQDVLARRAALRQSLERIGVRDAAAIERVQADMLPAGFVWEQWPALQAGAECVAAAYQNARASLWWMREPGQRSARPALTLCAPAMIDLARDLGWRSGIRNAARDVERFDLAHMAVRHGRATLDRDTGLIRERASARRVQRAS